MISQVCPDELRVLSRRADLVKVRKTREYRERSAFFLEGRSCVICGTRERLQLHHTSRDDYKDAATYLRTLDKAVPMCFKHHHRWHTGKTAICTRCKKELIPPNGPFDYCYNCRTPEEIEKSREKKEYWKRVRRELQKRAYENAKRWRENRDGARRVVAKIRPALSRPDK